MQRQSRSARPRRSTSHLSRPIAFLYPTAPYPLAGTSLPRENGGLGARDAGVHLVLETVQQPGAGARPSRVADCATSTRVRISASLTEAPGQPFASRRAREVSDG